MIRRFNRYELKYIIPVWKRDQIIDDLAEHAERDGHSGVEGYRLVSLYYDSPGLDFFWAKVDGLKFRRKLRLRVYLGAEAELPGSAMVEIKQRTNRTVQKRRLALPLDIAEALCEGRVGVEALGRIDDLDREVASEVAYLVDAMQLRPSAITSYRRIAFVGNRYEPGVRITFDMILGTVISLIMLIIGSSVARAFTLVGAMSIIRFRNAMKETRDVAFVFMSMAVGMAVGVRFYMLAVFATIVLCALVAALTWLNVFAKDVRERILRVQLPYNLNHDDALAESFRQHTQEHRVIALETVRAGTLNEVVYSIVLKHRASTQAFLDSIRSRNENHKVTLILGQQEVDM